MSIIVEGGEEIRDKPPHRPAANHLFGNLFRIFITQRRRGRREGYDNQETKRLANT
ncbi:MAG: hypothetical protein FWH41_07200 [Treponema sp.]|nr:hypothetical protein [Treponema sp.]